MSPTKFTVHHLVNSRSLRIIWLLEELGLPFEVKTYKRGPDTYAPKELLEVHPLGKAPVLTFEDNGETIVLAESGAIVEFLVNCCGQSLAVEPSSKDYVKYLYYQHLAESTIMPSLMTGLQCQIVPKRAPYLARKVITAGFNGLHAEVVEPALEKQFALLESDLAAAGGQYFVGGKLTAADIMLQGPIDGHLCQTSKGYPTLRAWLKTIKARPAYAAAEAKGGKNDMSFFTK